MLPREPIPSRRVVQIAATISRICVRNGLAAMKTASCGTDSDEIRRNLHSARRRRSFWGSQGAGGLSDLQAKSTTATEGLVRRGRQKRQACLVTHASWSRPPSRFRGRPLDRTSWSNAGYMHGRRAPPAYAGRAPVVVGDSIARIVAATSSTCLRTGIYSHFGPLLSQAP